MEATEKTSKLQNALLYMLFHLHDTEKNMQNEKQQSYKQIAILSFLAQNQVVIMHITSTTMLSIFALAIGQRLI